MILDQLPPYIATALVLGLVFAALTSLAGFAYLCIAIWDKLKAKPSLQETLATLVTKDDLLVIQADVQAEISKVESRTKKDIDVVDERLSKQLRDMQGYNLKIQGELFTLLRTQNEKFEQSLAAYNHSVNRELNTLSKEVGKLSGLIQTKTQG
jgi:hypothetical protein